MYKLSICIIYKKHMYMYKLTIHIIYRHLCLVRLCSTLGFDPGAKTQIADMC